MNPAGMNYDDWLEDLGCTPEYSDVITYKEVSEIGN